MDCSQVFSAPKKLLASLSRSKKLWAALTGVLTWMWVSTAIAAAPDYTAERFPFISLGIFAFLVGSVVARIDRAWWELTKASKVARVLGVIIASVGVLIVAFGATEAPPSTGTLPWKTSWEAALETAQEQSKPVLVDFQADWCAACHELEAEVFHHNTVAPRLRDEFVLLRVDFDRDTAENRMLAEKFRVNGLPTIGFAAPDGALLERPTFEGKIGVEEFIQRLDLALSGELGGRAESEVAVALRDHGLWAALVLVFLAGVMSSLTPCVYPLIPITVGLFGARKARSRFEGFKLSFVYVLGIVATYSVLGIGAASAGAVFGAAMQSVWVVVAIAALFFVLGLSSLGLFQIQLPSALQTRLGSVKGGGFPGAFAMGLVAGVIAAPCVGPIVAGILLMVASQQDLFLGFILLATFAFGMGQLFLVLGTFSNALAALPKSGGWMDGVKTVFGIVFIGMAVYYLRYVIPALDATLRDVWLMVG